MTYSILYVEDDKMAREAFATYFRRKEYEVHVFENIVDAELCLQSLKPTIIISDQKLGGKIMGWEFLQKTIALSPTSLRFILSGYAESSLIFHSFKDGVIFDYISKNSTNDEIEEKIRKACEFWSSLHQPSKGQNRSDELSAQVEYLKKEVISLQEQLNQRNIELEHFKNLVKPK